MAEKINIFDYRLCFWDFDGVIKESLVVKTDSYFELFKNFGLSMAERVKSHHLLNGGISRFDKLPIYLKWAGIEPTTDVLESYCNKFSKLVLQGVINSPWVLGAEDYLKKNKYKQIFILVSATPQDELEFIIDALELSKSFSNIHGAPTTKTKAIKQTLKAFNLKPSECLMIGDAIADLKAAEENQVDFLLRRHKDNSDIFSSYFGASVRDFVKL